jgi:hypothetical protein|tara:strand:+ start:293 stop:526 length:234 start_codon:yes stop_codon:yes gene_type:complete
MNAEETVFGIDDLRKHIFSFLRSKPHKSCKECNKVLEWNKGIKQCEYIEWTTIDPFCHNCFKDIFTKNFTGPGCCIS